MADRAEERALEAYPMDGEVDCYPISRAGYIAGYHQAEKDLALSWEDVKWLFDTADKFIKNNTTPMTDEEFYKEVLKRYLKSKKV